MKESKRPTLKMAEIPEIPENHEGGRNRAKDGQDAHRQRPRCRTVLCDVEGRTSAVTSLRSLRDQPWLGEQVRTKARSVHELHGWLGTPARSLRRSAQKVEAAAAFTPMRPAPLCLTANRLQRSSDSVRMVLEYSRRPCEAGVACGGGRKGWYESTHAGRAKRVWLRRRAEGMVLEYSR